ncbi:MAG: hypothetical protein B2I17_01700 [Thermoplasmatales archaeon B_DKE]|nr:MAG: hypothetical protein B2I17_01700 [Thermoplasmatales archaeon B_DKE]
MNDDENGLGNLNRFSIGSALYVSYNRMQEEFVREQRICTRFMRGEYSAMQGLCSMAEAQARGHPELLKKFQDDLAAIRTKYGNKDYNQWSMVPAEASEVKTVLEGLLYDLGPSRIDERAQQPMPVVHDYGYRYDGRQLIWELFERRLKENRNLNIMFTGKVGGGKSYASLSIATYVSYPFDLSHMVFRIPVFIQMTKTSQAGQVVILDEAGVSASNREALSKSVKALGEIIQSTRYMKLLTIYTVPNISFVDRQIRLLLDLVLDHDESMQQGEFAPGIPEVSEDGKSAEFRRMKYGGKIVGSVFFPLPPPSIVEAYEKMREVNNRAQLDELQEKLEPKKPEDSKRGRNPNSMKNLKQYRENEDE